VLRAELAGPENDESPRCRSTGGFAGGGFGQPSISMSRNTITPITTNAVMSVVIHVAEMTTGVFDKGDQIFLHDRFPFAVLGDV